MDPFNDIWGFFTKQVAPAIQGTASHVRQHAGSTIHDTIQHVEGHLIPHVRDVIFPYLASLSGDISYGLTIGMSKLHRQMQTSFDVDALTGLIAKKAVELAQTLQGTTAGSAMDWILVHPTVYGSILVAIASIIIVTTVIGPALGLAGFGSTGIAASSLAAFIQSTIGNVAKGSIFSMLQSAGAGGSMGMQVLGTAVVVATGLGLASGLDSVIVGIAREEDAKAHL